MPASSPGSASATTTSIRRRPDQLAERITPRTRLILAETISNPLLRVADLEAIGRIAGAAGVPLLVDHTFAPLLCRPIELGATFVMHSVTKLIGGHSDLTLGAVVGPRAGVDRIRAVASTFGQTGNPFESWLALRGMATLSLRTDRTSASALVLAGRLEADRRVARVYYPGIPSHPDFQLARRLFKNGFGAMVTFDVGGRDQVDRLIRRIAITFPLPPAWATSRRPSATPLPPATAAKTPTCFRTWASPRASSASPWVSRIPKISGTSWPRGSMHSDSAPKRQTSLRGDFDAVQHFAVLRFLPIAPRLSTFRMDSAARGTLHAVSPTSTETAPTFSAVSIAAVVSGET